MSDVSALLQHITQGFSSVPEIIAIALAESQSMAVSEPYRGVAGLLPLTVLGNGLFSLGLILTLIPMRYGRSSRLIGRRLARRWSHSRWRSSAQEPPGCLACSSPAWAAAAPLPAIRRWWPCNCLGVPHITSPYRPESIRRPEPQKRKPGYDDTTVGQVVQTDVNAAGPAGQLAGFRQF